MVYIQVTSFKCDKYSYIFVSYIFKSFLECVPYAFEITGRLSLSRRYPHVSNEKFTAENAQLMMQLENLILPSME